MSFVYCYYHSEITVQITATNVSKHRNIRSNWFVHVAFASHITMHGAYSVCRYMFCAFSTAFLPLPLLWCTGATRTVNLFHPFVLVTLTLLPYSFNLNGNYFTRQATSLVEKYLHIYIYWDINFLIKYIYTHLKSRNLYLSSADVC